MNNYSVRSKQRVMLQFRGLNPSS